MYLIFEGIDTSGKSTQVSLLKKIYKDAIITKEPGGTKLGLKIREMILNEGVKSHKCELFLFLADRAQHYKEVIEPNRDKLIISDRGFISGMAYAMANHPEFEIDFLLELNLFALDQTLPDLIILLKTDKDLLKQRIDKKSEDEIEKRGIEYLLGVQQNMIDILNHLNIKYRILDANQSIEEIHRQIKGLLS